MAKRKRLTPPAPQDLETPAQGLETKGMFAAAPTGIVPPAARQRLMTGPDTRRVPPIADMAGAAAASAALEEVSAELLSARAEGRLVQAIALDAIDADYLVRDRLVADEPEMEALRSSIRKRGQQTPIEVIEVAPGRFGLISGWRRLHAMTQLQAEDGRAATILALIRNPATAQDAYVAMVEENEIRVGLSYFERARIVQRAVEKGIYDSEKSALQTLFASASRAKRSKIKSFLPIVATLGDVLRFPTAISERLGLDLAQRLQQGAGAALRDELARAAPQSAEDEQAILAAVRLPDDPKTAPAKPAPGAEEIAPGVQLSKGCQSLKLSGPGVTEALIARIEALLRTG